MDIFAELVATSWLLLVLIHHSGHVNFLFVFCDSLIDEFLKLVQCVLLALFTQGLAHSTNVPRTLLLVPICLVARDCRTRFIDVCSVGSFNVTIRLQGVFFMRYLNNSGTKIYTLASLDEKNIWVSTKFFTISQ